MKINDLKDKWSRNYAIGSSPILIAHEKMTTVKFWPTGLDENESHYNVNGWWINNQTGEPMVQELIHIKKEDLEKWHVVVEE